MGGMGGFFDVDGGADVPAAAPADPAANPFLCGVGMMAGNFQAEPAADARKLAFRAMRLALRFEGVLPAEKEAEDAEVGE